MAAISKQWANPMKKEINPKYIISCGLFEMSKLRAKPNTDHNCAQQWCQAYICLSWVLVCRESHYWVLTVTTKYETKESRDNITWL